MNNDNNRDSDGFTSRFKREIDHFSAAQANDHLLYNINYDNIITCAETTDTTRSSMGVRKMKKAEKKVKKPRYAFQTRSQVDILDDGYRWRKYGQKNVKNNNFPRN
ncbi:hypothetical protein OROHE_021716 [Orobanche hederae]